MTKFVLAIDLGGSKIMTACAKVEEHNRSEPCELHGVSRIALTNQKGEAGKEEILLRLPELIEQTFRKSGLRWSEIDSIGATMPGFADARRGYWIEAPFSGIRDLPLADILREKYDRSVFADNDVNACAYAEKIFGCCRTTEHFLWITVSNGIGGGLVLNGEVFYGASNGAAEIGHFCVKEGGHRCGCGNFGCLEVEAAGPAIARRFRERLDDFPETKRLFQDLPISAATIAHAARNGDRLAQETYDQTGYYLGCAAAWAANLLNPERIVFGGGVSQAFDLFSPVLKKTFFERVFRSVNKNVSLEISALGENAALYGAVALTCRTMF